MAAPMLNWRAQSFLANRDAIIVTDADGRILDWNPAAERMYGYSRDEVLGKTTALIHRPEDASALVRAILDGLARNGYWSGEITFVCSDGTRGVSETTVTPLLGDDGQVVGSFGVNRDVTERKRQERELRALQALTDVALSSLALDDLLPELIDRLCSALATETATLLLLESDDGRALRASDADTVTQPILTVRATRGLEEEMTAGVRIPVGEGFAGTIAASAAPLVVEDLSSFAVVSPFLSAKLRSAAGVPLLLDGRVIGVVHVGSIRARHFTDAEVGLLQQAADRVAHAVDRAQVYQAERAARTQAEAATARLQTVLDVLPAGISIADAHGHVEVLNPAFLAAWGRSAPLADDIAAYDEWKGWWTRTGERVHAEEWAMARTLLTGEVVRNDEIDIQAFDGTRHTILNDAAPIRDKDTGEIVGGVVALLDVTEQRQVEREAAKQARQLEATFEAMADGVVLYDERGELVRWNAALAALFEFDRMPEYAELPLDNRPERLRVRDAEGHPIAGDDLPFMRAIHGEDVTGASAVDLIVTVPSGIEKQVNVSAAALRDEAGRPVGAVAVYRDVTWQRRLERELAERARDAEAARVRWQAAMDGAPEWVCTCDADQRLTYVNPAYERVLGRPAAPEVARDAWSTHYGLLLPDGSAPFLDDDLPLPRALSEGQPVHGIEVLHRTITGEERVAVWDSAPIRTPEGELLGAVAIGRDMTERRRLERRTHEALDALLALTEDLVRVPDASHAAAAGTTGDALAEVGARLVALVRRVFGCDMVVMTTLDSATGRMKPLAAIGLDPEIEARWWHDVTVTPLHEYLGRDALAKISAHQPTTIDFDAEPLLNGADYHVHRILMVPLVLGDTIVGLMSVEHKRTPRSYTDADLALMMAMGRLSALAIERERLLGERAEAEARALAEQETNAQMQTFVGIAGHELRTPVTSVRAAVQLAERAVRNSLTADLPLGMDTRLGRAHGLLERADQQLVRLNRLVEDLLDMTRIGAGRLDLRLAPDDLGEIVRDAVETQRLAWPSRSITLDIADDAPVSLSLDADRIGQVVTNFLTNALKYSRDDQPVHVDVTGTVAPVAAPGTATDSEPGHRDAVRRVRVAVRDHGPGIPPESLAHLWEPFHQVDGIRQQSGSSIGLGLGLSISREIVERHGGSVGVTSTLGAGSTFEFTLPLASGT